MKVLNVNMSINPLSGGGTAERIWQLSRHLVQAGVGCRILTLDIGLTAQRSQEATGIGIRRLPCLNQRYYIPAAGFTVVHREVNQADIIHLTGHWTLVNLMAFCAAALNRRPYVVCPAGALGIFGRSATLKRVYNMAAGRRIIAEAHGHVAISTSEYADYARYGIAAHRIRLIPNGIDGARLIPKGGADFRRQLGIGDNPLVLFVGRLNLIKGPDLLMRAFRMVAARCPHVHLCFVGPDEGLEMSLIAMADHADLRQRVHFTGYLGGKDKIAAYDAADLLVVPSRREAMSIVALEAGACATPVLLSNRCGFNAAATIGGGDTVPPDATAIADALRRLLLDRNALREMGFRFQRFVLQTYTWQRVADAYIDYFREIIDGSKGVARTGH